MEERPKKDVFDAVREVVEATKSFPVEDQMLIIKWACEKLNITPISGSISTKTSTDTQIQDSEKQSPNIPISHSRQKDIKTFIGEKKPKSDNHFAAAVAYYYQFEAGENKKDSINKNDLVDATRLVNWDRLKRPDQTLVNSTKAGLLDNTSRGQYRLNSVGENLVAMVLPGGGEEVIRSRNISKAKPKKKKVSKK